jgi:hypothetical protein
MPIMQPHSRHRSTATSGISSGGPNQITRMGDSEMGGV